MASTSLQRASNRQTDAARTQTRRRATAWLALLLCLVCLALASSAVVFAARNHRSPRELVDLSAAVTLVLGFSLVGAVVGPTLVVVGPILLVVVGPILVVVVGPTLVVVVAWSAQAAVASVMVASARTPARTAVPSKLRRRLLATAGLLGLVLSQNDRPMPNCQ